jgi:hypothetical protein
MMLHHIPWSIILQIRTLVPVFKSFIITGDIGSLLLVVSDLAETMQSLQTIAEQCLPETWETDTQIMSCHSNSQETNCSTFDLTNLYRCQFCEDIFKGKSELKLSMDW